LVDVGLSYAAFFNQPLLADVAFIFPSEGGDEDSATATAAPPIFAHKIVLAARCDYWRLFFCSGGAGGFVESRAALGGGGLAKPPRLSASSSRQVSSSSLGGDGGESLVTQIVIRGYRRATFLVFLEYLYVGLSAQSLKILAATSLRNGEAMDAARAARRVAQDRIDVIRRNLEDFRKRGEVAPSFFSQDPLLTATLPRVYTRSNVADYIDLLRLSDEYACVQLRVFVEYLVYGDTSRTHLLSVDTVWPLLTAALLFGAPMLEFRCLRLITHLHESDEERQLTQARGFKKQRSQALAGYGFLGAA
jgi:hypothetical protein